MNILLYVFFVQRKYLYRPNNDVFIIDWINDKYDFFNTYVISPSYFLLYIHTYMYENVISLIIFTLNFHIYYDI